MKFNPSLKLVASSLLWSSLLFGASVSAEELQAPVKASADVSAVESPQLAKTQASSGQTAQVANQEQVQSADQSGDVQVVTTLEVPATDLYQEPQSALEASPSSQVDQNSLATQSALPQNQQDSNQLQANPRNVTIGVVPNASTSTKTGQGYFLGEDGYWYYRKADGQVATGTQTINNKTVFFKENGRLARGEFIKAEDGKEYYYDVRDGHRVTNNFVQLYNDAYKNGNYFSTEFWYYVDSKGQKVTGERVINGKTVFFAADGRQVKGTFAKAADGKEYYYDATDGHRVTNAFVQDHTYDLSNSYRYGRQLITNDWYYVGKDGQKVKGQQIINGKALLFDPTTGKQIKNAVVRFASGNRYYYHPDSGERVRNQEVVINHVTYLTDKDGKLTLKVTK